MIQPTHQPVVMADQELSAIHEGLIAGLRTEHYVENVNPAAGEVGTTAAARIKGSLGQLIKHTALHAVWLTSRPPFATRFLWTIERIIVWLQVRSRPPRTRTAFLY